MAATLIGSFVRASRTACNCSEGVKIASLFYSTASPAVSTTAPKTNQSLLSRPPSKNIQKNRAKLGPKPQKKQQSQNVRASALSLLQEIREDVKMKVSSHNIHRKLFFALSIPSTSISVASDLFQIAVDLHCVDYKILNGYLRILSDYQDITQVQKVFDYLRHIGYNPQYSHYSFILKCWIGPTELDMKQLESNFEQMKKAITKHKDELYGVYASVFIHKNQHEKLQSIIDEMNAEGIAPTKEFYSEVVSALARNSNTTEETLRSVLLMMDRDNIPPNRQTCNAVLNYYVKNGNFEKALNIGEMMENRGVAFYDDAFVPLIDGFRKAGIVDGVLHIIEEVSKRKIKTSRAMYTSLISLYATRGSMVAATRLLQAMQDAGLPPEAPTYNCLLKGYLEKDLLQEAFELLMKMKEANVMPSLATFPLFVEHFRKKNDFENIKQMLVLMRQERVPINVITYSGVMAVAIRNYGFGEEARTLMKQMDAEGVQPTVDFFSSTAASLLKKKDGDSFFELLDLMDQYNMKYERKVLSPILFHYTSVADYTSAWAVLQRAMLQRFDLKTLPQPQKQTLKMLGLMHPVENGILHQDHREAKLNNNNNNNNNNNHGNNNNSSKV